MGYTKITLIFIYYKQIVQELKPVFNDLKQK